MTLYVRDRGRMCNNILQFGHAWAWAREHGLRAVSMRFCYKYPGFAIGRSPGHDYLHYVLPKAAAALRLMPVVAFDDPAEDPAQAARKEALMMRRGRPGVPGAVVEGWWLRHYDLFLKYRREITQMFAFTPAHPDALPRAGGAEDEAWLALHVRRGDYATWNGGRYCFSDSQYLQAVRRFAALLPRGRRLCVAVFTNDPSADRQALRQGIEALGARAHFPDGTAVEDLEAMSQADYIIGPPSTFSLVAAMYRDLPLYWIEDPGRDFTLEDFGRFATLMRYEY